jgi:multidrug resistance efflux pump
MDWQTVSVILGSVALVAAAVAGAAVKIYSNNTHSTPPKSGDSLLAREVADLRIKYEELEARVRPLENNLPAMNTKLDHLRDQVNDARGDITKLYDKMDEHFRMIVTLVNGGKTGPSKDNIIHKG